MRKLRTIRLYRATEVRHSSPSRDYRLLKVVDDHALVKDDYALGPADGPPDSSGGSGSRGDGRRRQRQVDESAFDGGEDARIQLAGTEEPKLEGIQRRRVAEPVDEFANASVVQLTSVARHLWGGTEGEGEIGEGRIIRTRGRKRRRQKREGRTEEEEVGVRRGRRWESEEGEDEGKETE